METLKRIVKETVPVLFLCTVGGVVAGLFLQGMSMELGYVPGVLVLLPAILGMRGNISGALGSRLGSALHLGLLRRGFRWHDDVVRTNFTASMILNILMSFFLGVLSHYFSVFAGLPTAGIFVLTLISLIAGTLAGFILTVLTFFFAIETHKHGMDPDNVLAPSLATIGDISTILCLLFAVRVAMIGGLI